MNQSSIKPGETAESNDSADEVPSRSSSLLPRRFMRKLGQLFRPDSTLEESVAELLEEHEAEGTPIRVEERIMLTNLLGFRNLRVDDVMVPRSDITAVDISSSLEDLRHIAIESGHTRLPIFEESLDNVRGFMHSKDLISYLGTDKTFSLRTIMREVLFVPPSMMVMDLLAKMRSSRLHMALVVDEYGGTDGLVTIEDIVEEIVGDIADEYDHNSDDDTLREVSPGAWEVNARMEIETLEEKLGITFTLPEEKEDYDSIGGLIFSLAGRIPATGEIITHPNGVVFTITDADPRRVQQVLVKMPESAAEMEVTE